MCIEGKWRAHKLLFITLSLRANPCDIVALIEAQSHLRAVIYLQYFVSD